MRKRYILLAIASLEILALPAAANIFGGFEFSPRPYVIAAEIPVNLPGQKHYFVSSNSPFAITVQNLKGEVKTEVTITGVFGQVEFGRAATLAQPERSCANVNLEEPIIFVSEAPTSDQDGQVIDRSIMVSLFFIDSPEAQFTFMPGDKAANFDKAGSCNSLDP